MSAEIIPFNPLDKKNLGASVAEALLAQPLHALDTIPDFKGAGVYAIYYQGDFPAYEPLTNQNRTNLGSVPIYIGKAIPDGARKGGGSASGDIGRPLSKRLKEHAKSIHAVENLQIEHFQCRFLVVDDIWIPLGESLLIAHYSPVWNTLLDGFGNHDPGKGRYQGLRPRWDTLHTGRMWALKCQERPESAVDITREVKNFLSQITFPSSDRFITG